MPDLFNIEAEQAVLGALLVENTLRDRILDLSADHFHDPVHADIFARITEGIAAGDLVSPVTMRVALQDNEGLEALGGPPYLVRLAGAAITIRQIRDYAKVLMDLWARRKAVEALQEAQERLEAVEPLGPVLDGLEHATAAVRHRSGIKRTHESFASGVVAAIESAVSAYQNETPAGVKTGLTALDNIIGSCRPGDLIIIAGRPSMGKTTLGMNIAQRAAETCGTIVASLEMTSEQLATRGISQRLREKGEKIEYARIFRGGMSEDEMRKVVEVGQEFENLPLRVVTKDASERTSLIPAIRAASKYFTEDKPLGMVVIDYLQRVRGEQNESDYQAASRSVGACKDLAMSLGVPVLLLSQLSREVERREDKRPKMSDLRDSGRIEEDADVVIFPYREEYYQEREKPTDGAGADKLADWEAAMSAVRNQVECIVAKNRGGPIASAKLYGEMQFNYIGEPPQREIDF